MRDMIFQWQLKRHCHHRLLHSLASLAWKGDPGSSPHPSLLFLRRAYPHLRRNLRAKNSSRLMQRSRDNGHKADRKVERRWKEGSWERAMVSYVRPDGEMYCMEVYLDPPIGKFLGGAILSAPDGRAKECTSSSWTMRRHLEFQQRGQSPHSPQHDLPAYVLACLSRIPF